jgi:iron complex outermembrane recepter protein
MSVLSRLPASIGAGIVLWASVHSMNAAAQSNAGESLAEIVVTATKRDSTVQNTPVSLTAVSGQEITDRGLSDFTALAQSIPGISMRSSGPGQTEFELRGLTSAGGNSSTVGFYLDDVPLTAPAEAQNGKVVIDPNLYDLNRVEVLRGPQGTLYGSGSMGGAIKVVPNAPRLGNVEASAQVSFGDTDGGGFNHAENAMINLPIGDELAIRIVGSKSDDSGWINRVVIADGQFPSPVGGMRGNLLDAPVAANFPRTNDSKLEALRLSVLWKPNDALTVAPMYLYQRIDQGGLSDIDSTPGTNATYQPFNEPEPFSDNFNLGALSVKYALPLLEVSSTTSYWTRDELLRQAGSEEIADALGLPFYVSDGGFGPTDPTPLEDDKSHQLSEELRLTSTGDSRFQWLVGAFYSDFRSDWNLFLNQPGALPGTGTTNAFTQFQPTKIIQNALFGELSFQLTSALKATAGLRRYHYDTSVDTSESGFLSAGYSAAAPDNVAESVSQEKAQGVSPKFDLSYQASEQLLIYSTVAKGFRPGGANNPIPTTGALGSQCEAELQQNHGTTSFVASPIQFQPDDVWSYELGEKWRSATGRLTLNGAMYFEKWNGVQQNIPLACGYPYTDNAGYAQIYGAELELKTLVTSGLTVSLNGGYTHAVFVGNNLETGITSGTQVQDVPQWTSSASIAYRRAITSDLSVLARADNNYVAGHYDATAQLNRLPSYDLTNFRLGIEAARWSAMFFVKNAFNEKALLTDVPAININAGDFNRVAVSQPLTYGLELNYRYGQ